MRKVFSRRLRRCGCRTNRFFSVLLVALCIVCLLLAAFFACRPIMTAFAESQALWIATKTANRTAAAVLQQYADVCNNTVSVVYNEHQQVSSICADTAAVNTVRTALTDAAMTAMEQYGQAITVSIPVGTLMGARWLSGWGPLVTFPMSYTATVLSDVSSSLVAVGINQSTYRVLIHLDISLYVVTPGGRSTVSTQVSYPMAESVLLGEVPDNLTEVYGDDQSLVGKIFDYGTAK